MAQLRISDVARDAGLSASAIRYYENIGLLPAASRRGGARRYDEADLRRLAVLQFARQTGFSLKEIQQLFHGFPGATRASERWNKFSQRKVLELQAQIDRLTTMQALLKRMQHCRCSALEECGGFLRRRRLAANSATPSPS